MISLFIILYKNVDFFMFVPLKSTVGVPDIQDSMENTALQYQAIQGRCSIRVQTLNNLDVIGLNYYLAISVVFTYSQILVC